MTVRVTGYLKIPFVYEDECGVADDLWEALTGYVQEIADEVQGDENAILSYAVIEREEVIEEAE